MPIVNSSFTTTTQADGSKNVVFTHIDQDGKPYISSGNYGALVDLQTVLDAQAISLSESLAAQEFEAIVGAG